MGWSNRGRFGVHDSEQHLQLFKALFHPIAGDKLRTSRENDAEGGTRSANDAYSDKNLDLPGSVENLCRNSANKTYPKGRCLLHIWKIQVYATMDDKTNHTLNHPLSSPFLLMETLMFSKQIKGDRLLTLRSNAWRHIPKSSISISGSFRQHKNWSTHHSSYLPYGLNLEKKHVSF